MKSQNANANNSAVNGEPFTTLEQVMAVTGQKETREAMSSLFLHHEGVLLESHVFVQDSWRDWLGLTTDDFLAFYRAVLAGPIAKCTGDVWADHLSRDILTTVAVWRDPKTGNTFSNTRYSVWNPYADPQTKGPYKNVNWVAKKAADRHEVSGDTLAYELHFGIRKMQPSEHAIRGVFGSHSKK